MQKKKKSEELVEETRKQFLSYYLTAREEEPIYDLTRGSAAPTYYKLEKISLEVQKIFKEVDELVEQDPKTKRSACRTICTKRPCCGYLVKRVSVLEMLPTAIDIRNYYLNGIILERHLVSIHKLYRNRHTTKHSLEFLYPCVFFSKTQLCHNFDCRPILCRTHWNSSFCMPWDTLQHLQRPRQHGEYRLEQLAIEYGIPSIAYYPVHIALKRAMLAVRHIQSPIKYLSGKNAPKQLMKSLPVVTRFRGEDLPESNFLLF